MSPRPSTPSPADRELAVEFARLVLTDVAPEEEPELNDAAEEYFADPEGVLTARGGDEALGFGVDLALWAPTIVATAVPVVQYLGSIVADGVKDAAAPVVTDRVRRLFRRGGATDGPALDVEHARAVHRAAVDQGQACGLSEQQARELADRVVSRLVVGG